MSFILDALKKSESDRQRRSGPALFEVRVASPRTRLPLWAIAIAALLAVNLAVVMWMVLRHAGASTTASAVAATALAAPAAARAGEAAGAAPPAAPPAGAVAALSPPPPAASMPAPPPATPAAAGAAAPGAPIAGAADEGNPEDYLPAQEAAAGPPGGHVRRGTAAGVPLYQDAAGTPGAQIPQLRLDLHVFAARPQDRFVMINMHRLREGEALPEGVRVESITPEGAILSYNGSRFLLPRE